MGGLVISPTRVFHPSTCLRRRCLTTTASSNNPQPRHTSAPAGDAQYTNNNNNNNTHRTALAATSSVLIVLALVLSTLLPADPAVSVFVRTALRVVPMYTLSLHLRTVLAARFRHQHHQQHPQQRIRGIGRVPLSVAWLATAALAAVVWLSTGGLVYVGLVACALLECGLVGIWGEGLFVASPSLPRVRMKVEKAVIESERKLEEGATGESIFVFVFTQYY